MILGLSISTSLLSLTHKKLNIMHNFYIEVCIQFFQLLKVEFHSFFFIFKTFVGLCSRTKIIFKEFFHNAFIERNFTCFNSNCYYVFIFPWLLNFHKVVIQQNGENPKQKFVFLKCSFNFSFTNWFSYLKPTKWSSQNYSFARSK
jgi:hypothetical protein